MQTGGSTYYYVMNLQGDVVALLDASGNAVASYAYDPYGKILSAEGTMAETNPLRYRGYYYDAESGLYYLQSRYYDPATCRFVNADRVLAGVGKDVRGYNLFAYCVNNPINMSDSSGCWPRWIADAICAVRGLIKKTAKAISKTAKPTVSSTVKRITSKSLPPKGDPNSSQTLLNPDGTPKQKRWYGPDGRAERDRDYNHSGDGPFPHDHEWNNGRRGKDHLPPSPDYKFSWAPVIGIGIVTICAIGIAVVIVDDLTIAGVADDYLLGPLYAGLSRGFIMIFR